MKIIKYLLAVSILVLMSSCKKEIKKSKINIKIADTNVVLPPAWAFGVLYGGYTNQEQTIKTIKNIQQHDYPIDAYWIDSWFWSFDNQGKGPKKYIDFVADTVAYPNREQMWSFLEKNNIKGGFWVWDCILEDGNETAFKEFDSLGYFSSKYLNTNPWHNNSTTTAMFEKKSKNKGTMCGNIDFKNPAAVAHFKKRMKSFFDEGADFLKLDRTSDINVVKAIFEISQEFGKETNGRGFMLSHTEGTNTESYKRYPCKWTDDTRSDWTIKKPTKDFNSWVPPVALKENIAMFTDPNNKTSKIPFLTNDTGGFDMGITNKVDEELYIRWLQFSTFNPIMEVFSQPENPTMNLAFNYSTRADSIFKDYSHLRMELFPYIYSYAVASRVKGVNMIRPVKEHIYDYYFGDQLLIAPVYEQGATTRKIELPKGDWFNFWTNEKIEGNQELVANAPINQIPVFVKEGAIIPMRLYSNAIETGSNNLLSLHVYPGSDGQFSLYEDDGTSNDYLNGIFAITNLEMVKLTDTSFKLTVNPVNGYYKGMNEIRKWQVFIHSNKTYNKLKIGSKTYNLTKKKGLMTTEIVSGSIYEKLEFVFK